MERVGHPPLGLDGRLRRGFCLRANGRVGLAARVSGQPTPVAPGHAFGRHDCPVGVRRQWRRGRIDGLFIN